ncbi:CFI-box-CTERM domain-containing protein [Desulfogranum marinum]|uniref:SGNH/GDSL hydrolase family protein n=1 Tax=Desulfogranum marinum TaxID=453220 RepID=UPI0029C923CC|nr:CFI-box-CTERM domain-containing protein [Desulfogranum marinum]
MNVKNIGATISIVFVSLVLLTGWTDAAEVIVAFGDSVTEGKGVTPYSSYLQNMVGSCASVVNQGVVGERTSGGVNRIDEVLEAHHPTYVIIMEGSNDAFWEESSSTISFNLGTMIDKVRAYGAVPILSNITPNLRNEGQGLAIPNYNNKISSLAADKDVTFVDAYNNVFPSWASLTIDGVHPNEEGAQVLADLFYEALPVCKGGSSGGTSSGDSGGGGCFIATAAFGSPLESHVVVLKQFRDQILLKTWLGREFVKAYYKYSPPIADTIHESAWMRFVVRVLLYPLVGLGLCMVTLVNMTGLLSVFMLLGSFFISLFLARLLYRRLWSARVS